VRIFSKTFKISSIRGYTCDVHHRAKSDVGPFDALLGSLERVREGRKEEWRMVRRRGRGSEKVEEDEEGKGSKNREKERRKEEAD
jgi:hypothetical protein